MVNSPDCCTSLFSSHLTLALTSCANPESSPIMSPMQYNDYVTLHRIWAHMHCIGADSIISVTRPVWVANYGQRCRLYRWWLQSNQWNFNWDDSVKN